MRPARNIARFRWLLRRFARDHEGVSAIEFAIVLPLMLSLYLGGVELGQGWQIKFKVTETARTVTDLTSQYVSIDTPTMSSILSASSIVVWPYSASNMIVTVSQVQVAANASTGIINWSCSLNGTARTLNSPITLPNNLQAPPSTIYLINGEVTYPYTPSIGYAITGTITMYQTFWFYPRQVSSIPSPPSGTLGTMQCT
jgi:Flp pilus assembly protein TadG